jgi:hypothetical protein
MHVPCFSNAVLLADLANGVSLHRHTEPTKLIASNTFLFYKRIGGRGFAGRKGDLELKRRERLQHARWRAGGASISFWVETEES